MNFDNLLGIDGNFGWRLEGKRDCNFRWQIGNHTNRIDDGLRVRLAGLIRDFDPITIRFHRSRSTVGAPQHKTNG